MEKKKKKENKKVVSGISRSTSAMVLRPRIGRLKRTKTGDTCNVWGPGDGPLEMNFEKTRTRRRKREKDSERYSPESGHIRKRYGDWREYLVVR